MIRITDITLTHIPLTDKLDYIKIVRFCDLLCLVGADYVEMPASMYEQILNLLSKPEKRSECPDQHSAQSVKARLDSLPLILHIDLELN